MTWLKIPVKQPKVSEIENEAEKLRADKKSFPSDIKYIYKADYSLIKTEAVGLTDRKLECLRQLCRYSDAEIKFEKFSSHRKVIGPAIVFFKKAFFSIMKSLLKDTIDHQKRFNQSVVIAYAEQFESPKISTKDN